MTEQIHRERVRLTVDDAVARITLVRGAGNGLDTAMGTAFAAAVDGALADPAVRVVVLAAEGPTFCVGGDLRAFVDAPDRGAMVAGIAADMHRGILALRRADVPVVSVVHGTVAGGGIGVALCADVVLMAAEAKLKMAYTAAGLTPDCGTTWFLARRLGDVRALDLALTNRVLTGAEAAAAGLVSRAVPADALAAEAERVVAGLRSGPRSAFAQTKRLISADDTAGLAARLDAEAAGITAAIASPDGAEGLTAFFAKRTPAFE